ncbi:MAG: hypothetical protein ACW99A_05370 [Candidatus Kariarchaeaceae archaeon]
MLTIIVTKLLLNGAIKTFLVKPVMNATMTIIPQSSVVQATLLNHDIIVSTGDLIKFGAEVLFDKFIGSKLDFQIQKLSKYIYEVSPADEFAALFSKQYADDEELIIDLTKFEDYLDGVLDKFEKELTGSKSNESEIDEILNKIALDLDLAINMSNENTFDDIDDEQLLIDQILEKNQKTIKDQKLDPLSDFPKVPKKILSDEKEIESILSKFN